MTWFILRRIRLACAIVVTLATGLLAVPAVIAQTPTAEQLEMLQSLSPEQQAMLQQAPGANADGGSDAALQRDTSRPVVTRQRAANAGDSGAATGVLGPNDWLTVELAPPGAMYVEGDRAGSPVGNPLDRDVELAPRRVRATPVSPPTLVDRQRWAKIIDVVKARNPYQLDRDGYLNLPGFAPMHISGLTVPQAVQRLSVEPALLELDISLSRLPVAPTGVASLKPYGYDLFKDAQANVSPAAGSPVSPDYVLGPGDELIVQLYGSQNRPLRLTVNREGAVSFPELGPIQVAGQRFGAAKANIESRVAMQIIGVRASVSLGAMRSIRVFVTGEVLQAGSYTVSGIDTVLSALFASGGVTPIGSLRNVELKRQDRVVRRYDLYDFLARGEMAGDVTLQPNDVIFIPTIGPTVAIDGEVRRPAIYELKGETTAESLLQLAGGLTSEADPRRSSINRVDEQYDRVVLDIDFSTAGGRQQKLRDGDKLRVPRLRPQLDSGVTLVGQVHRPGAMAWRPGLRLSNVIASIDELKPNADPGYIFIRRESGVDRKVEVLTTDLVAALRQPGGAADIALNPRDQITVFDLTTGRERIIKPVIDELRMQSGLARPTEVVRVEGRVKVPGEYPLEPGMTVSDLLRAGGGLDASAYGGKAELARYEVNADGALQTALIEVNIDALLRGDASADVALRSSDSLSIKETPDWTDKESVTLAGEVRLPGTYAIRRGETLHELLQRAGGLTSRAFASGSVFTRVQLRKQEQDQLDLYIDRLQSDVSAMSVQAAAANQAGASQSLTSGQLLLAQLKKARAVGRLVIDLPGLLKDGKGSANDVILYDGDVLIVPPQKQEVTVIGEVQTITSHLYREGLSRDEYISKSGGTTRKADKGKIYVVRADGSVVEKSGNWLRRGHEVAMHPGDTIVVPLDTERMPALPFWQAVTQIVYNLAVSVAAIGSF